MVFSSLNFLFFFLPLVLVLHRFVPARWKNPVLLVASVWFYAWGEPVYVVLMLLSVGFNYVTGIQIGLRTSKRARRAALISGVAVNLLILGFFKYYGFLVETFNALTGLNLGYRALGLPIGISFYTFQELSYIIDVYRGKTKPQRSLLDFAVYVTMFPQLVAGPIVKYTDIEAQLKKRSVNLSRFGQGVERLVWGLSKKVLLANNLGLLADAARAGAGRSVLTAWLGAAAYALQIYFDFSGYSDMAIGMGKMLGFSFPENFDYPYLSKSVTEFWRRWHMSLSGWFREYVYIPLGGNRVSVPRHILNLLVVWMLTGLWHGASWNFVLWGLYYGLLLILEKYALGGVMKRLPGAAARAITLALVTVGWVLFSHTRIADAGAYLGTMIGIGAKGFADRAFLYHLRSNLVLIALSVLCATPAVRDLLVRRAYRTPALATGATVLMFLLSCAFLVYNSYNPFLYFRF